MNPFFQLRRLWNRTITPVQAADKKRRRSTRPEIDLLEDRLAPATLTVNTALDDVADDANLTLREAILLINNAGDANAALGRTLNVGEDAQIDLTNAFGNTDTIAFNIPGGGVQTITVDFANLGNLPSITAAVLIDGYSQPGASENTLAIGSDAVLQIEILGPGAGPASTGLTITADNSIVQGLSIGNFDNGVVIQGSSNTVRGNYLGVRADGTTANPNLEAGVAVFGAGGLNTIGGATPGDRNVLSGNNRSGVNIGAANNAVWGNYIGTTPSGATGLPNGYAGVELSLGAQFNFVGTDGDGTNDATEGNVISGNTTGYGVAISGAGTFLNSVAGNRIGVDAAGTVAVPNNTGIIVDSGALQNTIGGLLPEQRNIVSGNSYAGIHITGGATGNTVLNNFIGVDVTGSIAVADQPLGVIIFGAFGNTVGDSTGATQNVISGNSNTGVYLYGPNSDNNFIVNNLIGTDSTRTNPVGNAFYGVFIWHDSTTNPDPAVGPANNVIETNTITGSVYGIAVDSNADERSRGNTFRQNAIFGNTVSGIDLLTDGPTTNDAAADLDADDGPNRLQNKPVLTGASATQVTGSLSSAANSTYTLEFFANSSVDPSGFSQGEVYLGNLQVTTDAAGFASYTFAYTFALARPFITATATDDTTGDTSEFSYAVNYVPSQVGYAVVGANTLAQFDLAAPGVFLDSVTIQGLQPGETIEGIDFRPATGQLYALGIVNNGANNEGRLYTIDLNTGFATGFGAAFSTTLIAGASYGFDFNPQADRIRVVSSSGENFRLNPTDGTLVLNDTALTFGAEISGVAYDRNDNDPSSPTTLYGIDRTRNELVRIGSFDGSPSSPNDGQIFSIANLGVANGGVTGFDIAGTTGYVVMNVNGVTGLYIINSIGAGAGAAILVGAVGNGTGPIRSLAIPSNTQALAPQATDDGYTTKQGTPITIVADGVLLNDHDPLGGVLTAQNFTQPANGTVVGNPDGSFTYTPNAAFVGTDTFTYEATRGIDFVVATVTIEVLAANKLAIGLVNDQFLVKFSLDDPTNILDTVAVHDMQPGERLLGIDFRPATGGLYGLGSSGRLYTIDPNTGDTTFVTLTADTVNDPTPTFTALDGTQFGVDFNPVPDRLRVVSNTGQNLRINVTTGSVITDGDLTSIDVVGAGYANNFSGATTTTLYTINAVAGTLNTQNPPNNGTQVVVGSLGLGTNLDGDIGLDISQDGTAYLTITTNGVSLIYTVDLGTGVATLVDSVDNGATKLQGFALALGNAAPVAVADTFDATEDTLFDSLTASVLDNDTDADGDTLTVDVASVVQPANGVVVMQTDGTFTYTPNQDFNGTDTFTYKAFDGTSNSFVSGTVTIDVAAVNDDPVNTVPVITTTEDTPVAVTGLEIIDVDSTGTFIVSLSIAGGAGVLTLKTDVANGLLPADITGNGSGTVTITATLAAINATFADAAGVTFTPTADFNGDVTFSMDTDDGDGGSSFDNKTWTVTAVADVTNDAISTRQGTAVTANVITGTNGATADTFENANAIITGVTQGTKGTVTFTAAGSVTYTPTGSLHGTDTFTYTVTSGGVTETATVTVTIDGVPTDITLTPADIDENNAAGAVVGVLTTTDPEGGAFTYALVSGQGATDNALFEIQNGDEVVAKDPLDFEAAVSRSIRVQVTDSAGNTFEKIVLIAVNDVVEQSPPTDIDLSNTAISENAGANKLVGDLTATDPDANETFTFALVAGNGDDHNADFYIQGNQLFAKTSLEYDDGPVRSVRIRVTDSANQSFEKQFSIALQTDQPGWTVPVVPRPATTTVFPNDARGDFVRDLYAKLLGREADDTEVAGWVNTQLTPEQIVNAIYGSPEARQRQVQNIYTTILGREASNGEVAGWVAALQQGVPVQQVLIAFLTSVEFQANTTNTQYVTKLYQTLLGRTPSNGEEQSIINYLNAGGDRRVAAQSFLNSQEYFARELDQFYTGYLNRSGDSFSSAWLGAMLSQSATDVQVALSFLFSTEFVNKPR